MTDEVKPELIKKTQETLGKFIKKPTLTEKLLKKPPFRFLHDICTSVIKETGFLEQVLGPEDKIENIKDKEGKIEFLQKVIAAVEAANGIKLSVKPSKVVAGLEASKTNEFLQALGKAVEKQQLEKKSSKTNVVSKTKSSHKTTKEVKEEPPDKKKSSTRSSKKVIENGVIEPSDGKTRTTSPKRKHSNEKREENATKEEKAEEERPRHKSAKNGLTEEAERKEEMTFKSSSVGAGESKDVPDVNTIMVNGVDGQGDQNVPGKEEVSQGGEQRPGHTGKLKHRRSSINNLPDHAKIAETLESIENVGRQSGETVSPVSDKTNLQNKSEFQNKTTPSSSGQINFSKKDTNLVREGTIISRPRTGIRPTTARPASARPAAPRIRDRGDVAVSEEVMKPASGKVQVIVDEDTVNDADDDNLISLETPNDIAIEEITPILPQPNQTNEKEHGHLVEQILEAQRELEEDGRFSEQKEGGKTEIEWDSVRSKESTYREIEKLRASIQSLTRTANPLGKLLDFFQEDIEIVHKELESWKEKNASYSLQIAQEKSVTDQYVESLKIHLKELQKSIDEQLEQINVVKANIIRNNDKICKLLSGSKPKAQETWEAQESQIPPSSQNLLTSQRFPGSGQSRAPFPASSPDFPIIKNSQYSIRYQFFSSRPQVPSNINRPQHRNPKSYSGKTSALASSTLPGVSQREQEGVANSFSQLQIQQIFGCRKNPKVLNRMPAYITGR